MADRFYVPDALAAGEYCLSGPEAHHLATVRRFQVNDAVVLFNGDGHDYPATLLAVGKKQVLLHVGEAVAVQRERTSPLVIASALPKGDRAEYLVEKLTELGATQFIPLQTQRSVVQPREAKREKFERLVIEASKQCGRNVLMEVTTPMHFDELLAEASLQPLQRLIAHTTEVGSGVPVPSMGSAGVLVAIGPEGGFHPDEVNAALAAGWDCLSFGPRVLRVETAASAACCWANRAE